MRITTLVLAFALLSPLILSGCNSLQTDVYREGVVSDNGEPGYITVQHCLIGFQGTVKNAMRTKEEAQALALELFEKAKAGEDFDKIVRKYTDDSPPGIYRMANRGFRSDMSPIVPSNKIYARDEMVPAFGNTGFPLKVGEVGLAEFDEEESPFGWHIVKRIN